MLVSLFDQVRFSAEWTFPGIVTEEGIYLLLQKSPARQSAHGTSTPGATQFISNFREIL
jgi:hypothetical protein